MNNRIKQFMDYKALSSSELADSIGVQRSNVTHVLQGRNKPGFQFISKLLETYPEINAKWLITGKEDMLVGAPKPTVNLFSNGEQEQAELPPEETKLPEEPKVEKSVAPEFELPPVEEHINSTPETMEEVKSLIPPTGKAIERIVVFYADQTFKQYLPSN